MFETMISYLSIFSLFFSCCCCNMSLASLTCEPIAIAELKSSAHKLTCETAIDYNVTVRPNIFGHTTQERSVKALMEYAKLFGNKESSCFELFELFVCTLYFPQCVVVDDDDQQQSAITSMNVCYHTLCVDARDQCENYFAVIGLLWPLNLDCNELFPSADPLHCIYPMIKSNQQFLMLVKPSTGTTTPTTILPTTVTTNYDEKVAQNEEQPDDGVRINVGGQLFVSTKSTLCGENQQSEFLRKLFKCDERKLIDDFSGDQPQDPMAPIFIDRDGLYFRPIINFLRTGKLFIDEGTDEAGVLEEANFYNLSNLSRLVKRKIRRRQHLLQP